MARPSTPLISKDKTLKAALKIVDEEGLSGLSIRRLGKELKISGYSLYHHFENKDAILVALCEHVLESVGPDKFSDRPWQESILTSNLKAHEQLSQHPNLVPALLKFNLLGVQMGVSDRVTHNLIEQGVPPEAILPLLEGLAILMAGFLSLEPLEGNFKDKKLLENEAPAIYKLAAKFEFLPRQQLLELVTRSFIEGIREQYAIL